ncbi:hypothetical protein AMS68_006829 [Peltaster fructicola]|uniref:Membrane-associated proteins in eicosanoid and glutathione metabolism n=1 Tax=Peltaster fructicola TaxID=286661 RepID=A0A6H0Y2R7_9PEZI|nr:hypothetical protein AMS68_006829 [Peltaster fructicola]
MSLATELIVGKDYGYVLIAAAGTFILSTWHGMRVTGYRKKAGIKYPQAYAEKSDMNAASAEKKEAMHLFNCAQRAHGNYLENMPTASIALLVSGLAYPKTAAVMGAGWLVSRVLFAIGYTNPSKQDGKGRLIGSGFWLFQLGLIGLTGYSGVKLLL